MEIFRKCSVPRVLFYFRLKRVSGPGIPIIFTDFLASFIRQDYFWSRGVPQSIVSKYTYCIAIRYSTWTFLYVYKYRDDIAADDEYHDLHAALKRTWLRIRKKKKTNREKERKRSIIKFNSTRKGCGGGGEGSIGSRSRERSAAHAGRERKEFPTTSGLDFIQQQKRWNLCASRLTPSAAQPPRRRIRHAFFFFFFYLIVQAHKSQKNTGNDDGTEYTRNMYRYIYIYIVIYVRWILRIVEGRRCTPFSFGSIF